MAITKELLLQRFQQALVAYREDNHLDADTLGKILERPTSTVYRWLSGSAMPPDKELRRISSKLNWDYDRFFHVDVVLDELYNLKHLSITALNQRYLDLLKRDPTAAGMLLPVAGALVFKVFWGIFQPYLLADSELKTQIHFEDVKLTWLHAAIRGHEGKGLQIVLAAPAEIEGQPDRLLMGDWVALSDTSLAQIVVQLKDYRENRPIL